MEATGIRGGLSKLARNVISILVSIALAFALTPVMSHTAYADETEETGTENSVSDDEESTYDDDEESTDGDDEDSTYDEDEESTDEDDEVIPSDATVTALTQDEAADVDTTDEGYAYVSFTPSASGYYTIYSSGSDDTYACLYSYSEEAGYTQLASDDDSGDNLNASITYSLEADATYYAVFSYFSGGTGTITVTAAAHTHTLVAAGDSAGGGKDSYYCDITCVITDSNGESLSGVYYCEDCGQVFADSSATTTVSGANVGYAYTSHTYTATVCSDGTSITYECSVCGRTYTIGSLSAYLEGDGADYLTNGSTVVNSDATITYSFELTDEGTSAISAINLVTYTESYDDSGELVYTEEATELSATDGVYSVVLSSDEDCATLQFVFTDSDSESEYLYVYVDYSDYTDSSDFGYTIGYESGYTDGYGIGYAAGVTDQAVVTAAVQEQLDSANAIVADYYTLYAENVSLSYTSKTYTGKALKPTVTVTKNGTKLTEGTDYTVSYSSNTNVGTATVTVTGKGSYSGTAKATFKITKASQSLKVTKKTKTVKYSKVKKAKQTVKAITKVSGAKGTVTYKKTSGSSKLSVNSKTGKVTVKKGTKKGTYKIKVKVTSKATSNYKSASKTVTVTVKVK